MSISDSIQELDFEAISLIETLKLKEFAQYLESTQNTICGENPL